jgi:hypothetical protein
MIITPHGIKEFRNDPVGFIKKMNQQILSTGDTKICAIREPIMADFPKDEGIFFIFDKLLELECHTSENIANTLIPYIPPIIQIPYLSPRRDRFW